MKTGNKTVFKTDSKRFSRGKATMKAGIRLVKHWPVKEQVKMIRQERPLDCAFLNPDPASPAQSLL